MDSIKLEKLITENMKSIFGFALTRIGNVNEAEYLASDIIYEILKSAEKLKDEERFYGFMWKIAENTYVNYLRKKIAKSKHTDELDENVPDESDSVLDEFIKNEELNLLRRELSLLSKQYRDATVLYYIENLSCSEIAKKLQISTEMVKYYLFRARKIIREGMNMDRSYGEKSYSPNAFEIDFWGTKAGQDSEYVDFQRRKIKGNILLTAYYSPVTLQEISTELGVALPYLEDEIKLLEKRQYIVCNNGKYLTNIPIFTAECTERINSMLEELTRESVEAFVNISDKFLERFGSRFKNENLARWQKLLMCLYYSLQDTDGDFENKYGELPSDGPYSVVNGGGGSGVVWGRSAKTLAECKIKRDIYGIYCNEPSENNNGCVIAMNFGQNLNAQRFYTEMTDALMYTAQGRYSELSEDWRNKLEALGYSCAGKPNFAVWTIEEYRELRDIVGECVSVLNNLNSRTSEIAANVLADIAPVHIRKTAEYVGALIYCHDSVCKVVKALLDMNWLTAVDDKDKPTVCVVKS